MRSFSTANNYKPFQIRAAIPIRKGEHISISYTDPMWGTANRQHHLYETKFFRCRCARCLDPTEMNTDFSSLRCPSCSIERPGYLTPSEPLDHTKSWQCDVCKKTEPANYVSAVIRSIGEELVWFLKNFVVPAMFSFGFCLYFFLINIERVKTALRNALFQRFR